MSGLAVAYEREHTPRPEAIAESMYSSLDDGFRTPDRIPPNPMRKTYALSNQIEQQKLEGGARYMPALATLIQPLCF